jgi:hypothetical protein
MSAKAEALRFPGQRSDRSQWLVVLLALLVAVAVAVTATVLSNTGTADRVPAKSVSHANDGAAVAPASSVLQVGGTSVYRYHPLPGANTVFELVGSATSAQVAAQAGAPTVGGSSAYRYHTLP